MDSEHQRTDVEVAPNVPALTSTSKLENVRYIESYSVISILKHIKTSLKLQLTQVKMVESAIITF